MPLAIELAALLTRHMSLREIADRLEYSLDWLSSSLRNAPARHRSMAAVFEQIWSRLDGDEQRLLEQLAFFQGSCTRDAAEAVAGATAAPLVNLVDKSLLNYSSSGRISIPTWLYGYARQRLQARPGAMADVQQRYCTYYAALLRQQMQDADAGDPQTIRAALGADLENVRAAWRYAAATGSLHAVADELGRHMAAQTALALLKKPS
jgi:non-specific serine/threonine protein kinase